jgi:tetratricopeptide (TPR) repeat protein
MAISSGVQGEAASEALLSDRERSDLAWYLEDYHRWPYEGFATRARAVEALLPLIGQRLYMSERPGTSLGRGVFRVELDTPTRVRLPWELLHDGQEFLGLRETDPVVIVRAVPGASEIGQDAPAEHDGPLRVLLVTARPHEAPQVDHRAIALELLEELAPLRAARRLEIELLRPATFRALYDRLRVAPTVHMVHFDGHGEFREIGTQGQGSLLFENSSGKVDEIAGADFAKAVQGTGVRLVVLTACRSAQSSDKAISSTAATLSAAGVDGVVAMAADVLVTTAAMYTEAFYRALASGQPIEESHANAVRSLAKQPTRHIHRRATENVGRPILLQDWWLPQLYFRRSFRLIWSQTDYGPRPLPAPAPSRVNGEFSPPLYGFVGRSSELLQVERILDRAHMAIIAGRRGEGKSTLAREAADWLTRVGSYERAFLLRVPPRCIPRKLWDQLMPEIGGVKISASSEVAPSMLLVLDDVNALAPPEGLADEEALTSLKRLLDDVQRSTRVGVLLTTTSTTASPLLRDVKSELVLRLSPFSEEEAHTLALQISETTRGTAPASDPTELDNQLETLDFNAELIIRLFCLPRATGPVAPDELAPAVAADVGAWFDGLGELEQSLAAQLRLFQRGAIESWLLRVTDYNAERWATTRERLELLGLLSVEPIRTPRNHKPWTYLRFHPVLTATLDRRGVFYRSRALDWYKKIYESALRESSENDGADPVFMRRVVALELPNFKRLFNLAIRDEDAITVAGIFRDLSRFLRKLGRSREEKEIQNQLGSNNAIFTEDLECARRLVYLGDEEVRAGLPEVARQRFEEVQEQIDPRSPHPELQPGSKFHAQLLGRIARCLPAPEAESLIREAIKISEAHLESDSEANKTVQHTLAILCIDLGNRMLKLARFNEAVSAFQRAWDLAHEIGNLELRLLTVDGIVRLAIETDHLELARGHLKEALRQPGAQRDPTLMWQLCHRLGNLELEDATPDLLEAERRHRQSLEIATAAGNASDMCASQTSLARLAAARKRYSEAKSWMDAALETAANSERPELCARALEKLALVANEAVEAGQFPPECLSEAATRVEQAIHVRRSQLGGREIWRSLRILAETYRLAGRSEDSRQCAIDARKSYAADPIERQKTSNFFGSLIRDLHDSLAGETPARQRVVQHWFAKISWPNFRGAVERLWTGERDWEAIAVDLPELQALILLLALEAPSARISSGGSSQ